jgi:Uma2 family endonuclease
MAVLAVGADLPDNRTWAETPSSKEAETVARPETLTEAETETENETLPVLEPGDHLTRDEFERRYDAMPGLKKAELIEGIVYMGSPVRLNQHGQPHGLVMTWLGVYWGSTPGLFFGDNVSIRLDGNNMHQPDAAMIIEPARGGQSTLSERGYIEGGPELVVEVAASTASMDLNTKLRVYRRNNVREYVVWRVLDRAIDWFVLRQGEYQRLPLEADGTYRSEVFPGLWLEPRALVEGDLNRVLDALRRGLDDPAHRAFVARLNPAAG